MLETRSMVNRTKAILKMQLTRGAKRAAAAPRLGGLFFCVPSIGCNPPPAVSALHP
jgi:hypothetical protein